jgi:hypothetical protein
MFRATKPVEQERIEALGRALWRRFRAGLFVCWGTMVVVAFAFGVAAGFFRDDLPSDWPRWLVFAALVLPFLLAMMVIPSLAQWLVMRGRDVAVFEAVNTFALAEAADYRALTGRTMPTVASIGQARRWLSRNEGYGTRHRIRTLIWAGELSASAGSLAGFPVREPIDGFHKALLRQVIEYAATGRMDLTEARAELDRVPPSPEREAAAVALALEEARLVHDRDGDWLQTLADARAAITTLPKGASVMDRIVAGLPLSLVIMTVVAVIIWVTQYA